MLAPITIRNAVFETPAEQCIKLEPCKRIVTFILEAILQDHATKFMPSSSHLNRPRQTRFAVHSNLAYPVRLLCDARNLKKTLSGLDVSHGICFRRLWECAIGSPQVDQRGHWLEFLSLQHIDLRSRENEVAEAAVHALFDIQVVERIDEVSPVEVGVDAEHLSEDSLAHFDKVGREATALTNPVART